METCWVCDPCTRRTRRITGEVVSPSRCQPKRAVWHCYLVVPVQPGWKERHGATEGMLRITEPRGTTGRVTSEDGTAGSPASWASFEAFYEQAFPLAHRCALGVSRDREVAWEAVQEAAVKAFIRWRRLENSEFAPFWLARVAMNEARRQRRRRDTPVLEHDRSSGLTTPDPTLAVQIRQEIARLPRRQMESVVLHYLLDMSQKDVALIMGCDVGSVKTHLSRARARLSSRLGDAAEEGA